MAIILEGPDNAGKSTLAAALAQDLGLEVKHPGPRPTNAFEEMLCLKTQLAMASDPVLMDRVTSISTPCYTGRTADRYQWYLDRMLRSELCVLVYCRPPLKRILDFSTHSAKVYDTPEHLIEVRDNIGTIVGRYDSLMNTVPHFMYDYTRPDLTPITRIHELSTDIEEWHEWLRTR